MRFLKQIPTKVAILLILLLVGAIVYGGWRVSQRNVSESLRRGGSSSSDSQTRNDDDDREFETDLMESFANELDEADDLDREERDAAYEILKEADGVWKRVKQENRKALRRANQRPRIIPPKASDPFVSDPVE